MSTEKRGSPSRAQFLRAAGLGALAWSPLIASESIAAVHHEAQPTSSQAWETLLQGNRRYVNDHAVNCNGHYDRRAEVATGQHPFAMILGCADSRVPPEVIFDQRLGDLFTVRVAGNIADDAALGSLEYASLHFTPSLLVVLGHEKCGAVDATLEVLHKHGSAPGHIAAIVEAIRPAVLGLGSDKLDQAVRANVRAVVTSLTSRSEILASAVAGSKLRVAGAYYGLHTGQVELVD